MSFFWVLGAAPDAGLLSVRVVGVSGVLVEGVPLPGQPPRAVVAICGRVSRRVGLGGDLPSGIVRDRGGSRARGGDGDAAARRRVVVPRHRKRRCHYRGHS